MQDELKYRKPRPEITGRGIIPVVPPELPQKRSLLSRCNVRNTSPLLRYNDPVTSRPVLQSRNSHYRHEAPPEFSSNLHPLGLMLGSVIRTDSDMRLSPCPHSLETKFRVTSLRHRILFVCIISLYFWIVKYRYEKNVSFFTALSSSAAVFHIPAFANTYFSRLFHFTIRYFTKKKRILLSKEQSWK